MRIVNRRPALFAALLLVAAGAAACTDHPGTSNSRAAASQAPTGAAADIAGYVTDDGWDVRPHLKLAVQFPTSHRSYRVETDELGFFQLAGIAPDGDFVVRADDQALVGVAVGSLTPGAPRSVLHLVTLPAGTGTVQGRITSETGAPAKGATVALTFTESGLRLAATADDDGRYSVDRLPLLGNFTIAAHLSTTGAADAPPFATVASYLVTQAPKQTVDATLHQPGTVQSRLTNGSFAADLAGWTSTGDVAVKPLSELLKPTTEVVPGALTGSHSGFVTVGDPVRSGAVIVTAGPVPGTLTQTFRVGEDTRRLAGTVRFLSDEYPTYYGSEYNDAYAVTLVTPGGTNTLATGNLNASSWLPGIAGFSGATADIPVDATLTPYLGGPVTLQVSVWNVADDLYPSGVLLLGFNLPAGQPCDDGAVTTKFGNTEAAGEKGLGKVKVDAFDDKFTGKDGQRFQFLVELVAAEAGIDPGLLAVNALQEDWSAKAYLGGKTLNTIIGVDFWDSMQAGIKANVPIAKRLNPVKLNEHFINELGQDAGPKYEFQDGPDALRAVAATLKFLDLQLQKSVGGAATWDSIPTGDRFAILRDAYNEGLGAATAMAKTAAGGTSVLRPTGNLFTTTTNSQGQKVQTHNPKRHATMAAGQAFHISQKFFGNTLPCDA